MAKKGRKARKRDDVAQVVAGIHEVSPRYVNMVRDGDRENDDIINTAVEYELGKNNLIKELKKSLPSQTITQKHDRKKN